MNPAWVPGLADCESIVSAPPPGTLATLPFVIVFFEKKKKTGLVFEHILDSIKSGRVSVDDPLRRVHVLK